jgi:hypothetical protein
MGHNNTRSNIHHIDIGNKRIPGNNRVFTAAAKQPKEQDSKEAEKVAHKMFLVFWEPRIPWITGWKLTKRKLFSTKAAVNLYSPDISVQPAYISTGAILLPV